MKQSNQESLSSLMDGELPGDALRFLLRRLDHDEELRETWSRYHLIRDGLRHEVGILAGADFAGAVMARLDAAPAVTAAPAEPRRRPRRRWLNWSAGGAIAAGVAVVALVATQPPTSVSGGRAPVQAQAPATAAAAPALAAADAGHTAAGAAAAPVAPVAPSWLTPTSPVDSMAALPAAATFYDNDNSGSVVMPAAYSRQLAPYMSIRPLSQAHAGTPRRHVRYVLMDPSQGGSRTH